MKETPCTQDFFSLSTDRDENRRRHRCQAGRGAVSMLSANQWKPFLRMRYSKQRLDRHCQSLRRWVCFLINAPKLPVQAGQFSRQSTTSLRVVVGLTNLTESGSKYTATKLIKHSRYNKPYFANDIALIKLSSPLELNKLVQPIPFSPHEIPGNTTLFLSKKF